MTGTLRRGSPSDDPDQPQDDRPDPVASPRDICAAQPWAKATLREIGLQVTRPRQLVLAALRGRERPVTAQDLHRELAAWLHDSGASERAPGVTTMYRALAVLAEHGVLHCFPQGRGVTAYRLCPPFRHHHLVCRSCGRVQEQPSGPTPDWVEALDTPGFAVEDYQAELVGLCAQCRDDRTEPHPDEPAS